jgi:hypothetical protein
MKMPAEQIERIKGLGYTEAGAQFLYIVAIHSGYFTLRQFCTFTRAARGKRSFLFARKLLQSEHASMRDYPAVGPVLHLFSRTVYGRMEKDNLRNRRRHSFHFIRTQLCCDDGKIHRRNSTRAGEHRVFQHGIGKYAKMQVCTRSRLVMYNQQAREMSGRRTMAV